MGEADGGGPLTVVVPAARDVGTVIVELSGWVVAQMLGVFVSAWRTRPSSVLSGVLLLVVLALALSGALIVGWKVLAFWLVPVVIVLVHATDLTRMRASLMASARPPYPEPPAISEEAAMRSPALGALHKTARVVAFAFKGRWLDAQNEESLVERGRLDDRSARLLDAARAFAALHAGERPRAAQLAIVSLPTGTPQIDRELALCVLAESWNDEGRLTAVARGWAQAEASSEMSTLARLASARLRARTGMDPAEGLERDTLRQMAVDARDVGDEAMADKLLALSQLSGPYR